jgi:hypothetical protein
MNMPTSNATAALEQSTDAKHTKLQPPFICPWRSSGCTHVTRTTALSHRRHIARHEKQEMRQRINGTASEKIHACGAKKLLGRLNREAR